MFGLPAEAWAVLFIFAAVFVAIFLELVDKALVALAGAVLVVLLRFISFEEAVHKIDFDTIGLLLGMMLVVAGLRELQVFDWLAARLAAATGGNPFRLLITFGATCAVLSAFLDNVTTVLVLVPLMIQLARSLQVDVFPYVIALVLMANIGGTLTLIGDPPNILLGTQVEHMTFLSFPQYTGFPVVLSAIVAVAYIRSLFRREFRVQDGARRAVLVADLRTRSAALHLSPAIGVPIVLICAAILVGFLLQRRLELSPAIVALGGAVALLGWFRKRCEFHHLLQHVEWSTLLFFCGLFVVVGAAEEVGLLKVVATKLVTLTDDTWRMMMLVLWSSALLSAVIDNIPFVAVMIPVLQELLSRPPFVNDPRHQLIWWALCLGACLGGNATQIGASANVVSCALARKEGMPISFRMYTAVAAPAAFLTIVISAIYLTILYYRPI